MQTKPYAIRPDSATPSLPARPGSSVNWLGASVYVRFPVSDRVVVAYARTLTRRYKGQLSACAANDGEPTDKVSRIPAVRVPTVSPVSEARRLA